jgi:hypothetical protein
VAAGTPEPAATPPPRSARRLPGWMNALPERHGAQRANVRAVGVGDHDCGLSAEWVRGWRVECTMSRGALPPTTGSRSLQSAISSRSGASAAALTGSISRAPMGLTCVCEAQSRAQASKSRPGGTSRGRSRTRSCLARRRAMSPLSARRQPRAPPERQASQRAPAASTRGECARRMVRVYARQPASVGGLCPTMT